MISYKFKLYPNKEQKEKFELSLNICRQTYNHLLAELSNGFRKNELSNFLLDLKVCSPEMKNVYSKVLQVENDNLFRNLKGLGNSKKNGNRIIIENEINWYQNEDAQGLIIFIFRYIFIA